MPSAKKKKKKIELQSRKRVSLKRKIWYSLNERKVHKIRKILVASHAQQDRASTDWSDTENAGLKTL